MNPDCVLNTCLSVPLIYALDARLPLVPVLNKKMRGGGERKNTRTKLGAEEQNTVAVVYEGEPWHKHRLFCKNIPLLLALCLGPQ